MVAICCFSPAIMIPLASSFENFPINKFILFKSEKKHDECDRLYNNYTDQNKSNINQFPEDRLCQSGSAVLTP